MPSSFISSVSPIVHALIDYAPTKVVDIGPGWGKYGLLCREYLTKLDWLDAVEVREGRLETQDVIYDHVFECDARCFIGWASYEMALFIDVIEHMSKPDGHALLASILGDGAAVLVSTPKVFIEQHDPRNPYEEHLSLWDWSDFDGYTIIKDLSTIDAIIYILR